MAGKVRTFLVVWAFSAFMLVGNAAPGPPSEEGTGQQWLSWSTERRSTFIDGYLAGYVRGTRKACEKTNELFEVGKAHRLGNDPAARCLAHLPAYSKDSGVYTTVLTDFYTRYPEYKSVPFVYLIWFLSDDQHKTAEALYGMALKGTLRTDF